MLAGQIDAYETQTHNRYENEGKLTSSTEVDVPVFDYRPGHSSYFYNSNTEKQRIILHYTTGFLGGDISTLTRVDYHVSVSFVVARNGRIYRLFPTTAWSYHTGSGTVGGNETISKSSIGIEISNLGYLERSGDWMWNYYGDRYCRVSETQFYSTLPAPFRNEVHFATYTAAQYQSVRKLLNVLCPKHGIARTFLPVATRYAVFGSSTIGKNYRGICSHVNYRPSGKWDIGPAFDWGAI